MKQYERLTAWMRGRGPMSLRQMLDAGMADVVGMEPGSLGKAIKAMERAGCIVQRGTRVETYTFGEHGATAERDVVTYRLVLEPRLVVQRPLGEWDKVWRLMDSR